MLQLKKQCMLSTLDDEISSIVHWLAPKFGELPYGKICLSIDENIPSDGISEPGRIWLHPRVLSTNRDFLSLTLAHEVAHQWWGLKHRSNIIDHEAMAEAVGLAWLNRYYGSNTINHHLSITRGRMFAALFSPMRAPKDAKSLGLNALVIYDCWRSLPSAFIEFSQSLLHGGLCRNQAASWLSAWQGAGDILPQPRLQTGCIIDVGMTGLPFSIRCRSGDHYLRFRENEKLTANDITLSEAQDSPVIAGNISSDVAAYAAIADY